MIWPATIAFPVFRPVALACICLVLTTCNSATTLARQKPLKVFILAGQSNMQGHAHIRTLPHIGMDAKTKPMLAKIQTESGQPKTHQQVWVNYLSNESKQGLLTTGFGADKNKIGPELMFGVTMSERLGEKILIIKVAWGGKSIHTDFRPPNAGPFELSERQSQRLEQQGKDLEKIKREKVAATGRHYRLMIDHVKACLKDQEQLFPGHDYDGYEIAGFVWFQGWNDMVDSGVYPNRDKAGGYDAYTQVLGHLVRDVRAELDAPNLPFVIGVMGVGGPTDRYDKSAQRYRKVHQNFRDAMAGLANQPEFKGNVVNVLTETCWDEELATLSKRKDQIGGEIRRLKKKGEPKDKLDAMRAKLMAEQFSDEEIEILELGKSNAEFHYLGSSKIMACIGQEFADALFSKMKENK